MLVRSRILYNMPKVVEESSQNEEIGLNDDKSTATLGQYERSDFA